MTDYYQTFNDGLLFAGMSYAIFFKNNCILICIGNDIHEKHEFNNKF